MGDVNYADSHLQQHRVGTDVQFLEPYGPLQAQSVYCSIASSCQSIAFTQQAVLRQSQSWWVQRQITARQRFLLEKRKSWRWSYHMDTWLHLASHGQLRVRLCLPSPSAANKGKCIDWRGRDSLDGLVLRKVRLLPAWMWRSCPSHYIWRCRPSGSFWIRDWSFSH